MRIVRENHLHGRSLDDAPAAVAKTTKVVLVLALVLVAGRR